MTLCKMILKWLAIFTIALSSCGSIVAYVFYQQLLNELPDIKTLRDIQYQTPFSIYTKDNVFIAQYGEKKRKPIHIKQIPKRQIQAFLAAEDDRYYEHPGVDYKGLIRASLQLLLTGKKKQGGSTITMQVTRNFLLSSEKTYTRKLKEIILSLQIEDNYSKDEILELYLNKIYMGHRSYGIVAAAETYYGKSLDVLSLAQQAMIAGLPKAPSIYNPVTNPQRALLRRNYVLKRMASLGYTSQALVDNALKESVSAKIHTPLTELSAPYMAEMIRQKIVKKYGKEAYTSGMKVYTTLDQSLQNTATLALRNTLHKYDKRHGYRALPHKPYHSEDEFAALKIVGNTYPAQILTLEKKIATAKLQDNRIIEIPWKNVRWARRYKTKDYRGARPRSFHSLFKVNDIIRVRALKNKTWELSQIPKIEGAFASLNPMNGAILALSGGYDFYHNKYNRATQSKRQPGSGFKPIVYTTALEEGLTASSIINDAPIIITSGTAKDRKWRPQNYSHRFYGPTRIRTALRKSRNIVSIRLVQDLGIDRVIETAKRFGFHKEQLPHGLSLALGSGYASPLRMANMYATFANGGFLVEPYFIERIEDYKGKVLFQAQPKIACPLCNETETLSADNSSSQLNQVAPRIISPQINFIMNTLLRDVVQRGTATRAKSLKRTDLAGKTGTTNDQRDAWFNGFTPTIVATAWVGLDSSKPLGRGETGGKTALPMWIEFMQTALKDSPEIPLVPPQGIVKRYINKSSGLLSRAGHSNGMWEYFVEGVYPKRNRFSSTSDNSTGTRTRAKASKKMEDLF